MTSHLTLRRILIYVSVILAISFGLYTFRRSPSGSSGSLRSWLNPNADDYEYPLPEHLGLPAHADGGENEHNGEQHHLREDGLLEVNPNARHPILDLIANAKEKWEAKAAKQSKTLHEAIDEYQRRYGRLPPKGFDEWWRFVQRHNVQLPDEYDQIYHDLEPFWAIDPVDFQKLYNGVEKEALDNKREYAIIIHKRGTLNVQHRVDHPRMHSMVDFIKTFIDYLPDFRATMDIFDEPQVFVSFENRIAMMDAAKKHIHINPDLATTIAGWASACPPDSPLRTGNAPPHNASRRTFIHDHKLSMDPCNHPSLISQNGFLARESQKPLRASERVLPTFAISKTALNSDILTVSLENALDDFKEGPAWEKKTNPKLLWRGSTTGTAFQKDVPWKDSQRPRLVSKTTKKTGTIDVLIPSYDSAAVGEVKEMNLGKLNVGFMDLSFAGNPIQCSPNGYCDEVRKQYEFRAGQGEEQAWKYKYRMDIDGNGWSSRFKKLLYSGSLIFKATVHPEWFTDRIQPWYHYVPVQYDLSDLYDSYLFFHGDLNGNFHHDGHARQIANQGKDWVKTFYRKRDMQAYMIRLFLEYIRLMSIDRDAMTLDMNNLCTSKVCKSVL